MITRTIRIILACLLVFLAGCALSVDTTTLDFGSDKVIKTFTLTVQGPVEWTIDCSEMWVTVHPDKNSSEGTYTIHVAVDRKGLAIGNYEATLNISATPEIPCPDVIVKMSVSNIPLPVPSEVSGYVYEDGTSNTITGASVSIGAKNVYSDDNGYYSISDIPAGSHTITASKEGYNNHSSTIDVIDDYTEYYIYMIPKIPPAPTIVISANPPTIKKGESTTLYWVSTNATSASIIPDINKIPVTGSYVVKNIDFTATYIITVEGPGGTAQASATVTVMDDATTTTTTILALPEVAISAIPSTIAKGQPTTLLWSTKDAGSAIIDHGIGPVNPTGGTLEVLPSQSVTYTITVQGAQGTASASTTVNVLEPSEIAIMVLTPNGGETWVPGTEEEITWDATQTITNVKIELLFEDTNLYTIENSTSNDGEHRFTLLPEMLPEDVPWENSTSFRILISDVLDRSIYDKSNRSFAITGQPGIYVETPDTLVVGGSGTINWKASPAIENVKIELIYYTGDAGDDSISMMLADSVEGSSGSFLWENIPDTAIGRRNRIKISSTEDEAVFGICARDFDILGGDALSLTQPDGGEVWNIGSDQTITWVWSGTVSKVDMKVTVDDGVTYYTMAENVDNTGSFEVISFGKGYLEDHTLWTTTVLNGLVHIISSDNSAVWSESADYFEIPITLGILSSKIKAARGGPDSDLDRLPDSIEDFLGTDPLNRDSDGDGIHDYNEIFGFDYFDDDTLIPDLNTDGIIAPNDAKENDDDIHAWFLADNDGDGIPNYLEYYGYTYDWMTDTYSLWNGINIYEPYFKTDPLQPSTDQDPYSDAVETSGTRMDVSVREPGNMPMVPAYPNIVVRLEGYEVTLNQNITYSEGMSLSEGTTWNRQTTRTHSQTSEKNWETGIAATVKFGISTLWDGGSITTHFNYGGKESSTNTNSTTMSHGGSIIEQSNWQKATSINPTNVAHMKLFLKVYNYGTSGASNIIPTLTLKIGGMNIATFQPGNTQINILEPGGVYPAQQGTYWVVDTIDTGAGVVPISLIMDELRALECGAPVSIVMTQMLADVMLMNQDGQWESSGDWSEYMQRCEAVCSNIFLDTGDGNFIHYLVYSDDSPTSPVVTFRDALIWIAGGGDDGTSDAWIKYYDQLGMEKETSLEGWSFAFDTDTLLNNGFVLPEEGQPPLPPEPDSNIANLVLGPDTTIIGKASRETIDDTGPVVHYAFLDEKQDVVRVCASDYNGIAGVEFQDKNGTRMSMTEVIANSGIYILGIDSDYESDGSEEAIITSINTAVSETVVPVLTVIYPEGIAEPPVISSVVFDLQNHRLSAQVTCNLEDPITSVAVYHDLLSDTGVAMTKVPNWWEDPNGYYAILDSINEFNWNGLTIVAQTASELYDVHVVTQNDLIVSYFSGSFDGIRVATKWQAYFPPSPYGKCTWVIPYLDLDGNNSVRSNTYVREEDFDEECWHDSWNITHPYDLWMRPNCLFSPNQLIFNGPYTEYSGNKTDFNAITRNDCMAELLTSSDPAPLWPPPSDQPKIYITKTSEGRFAKVKVDNITGGCDTHYIDLKWCNFYVDLEYVTFFSDQEIETYREGSGDFDAEYDTDAISTTFVYETINLDTGESQTLEYENDSADTWNNSANPLEAVDFWYRYYTGSSDPHDGGPDPGWMLFSNSPFEIYTGGTPFDEITKRDFYYSNFTLTSHFLLNEEQILDDPLTVFINTDEGRYAALNITGGESVPADGDPANSTLNYEYITFKKPGD